MKFVIAGCGIGGLATALGLSRLGHDIVMLEKTDALRPVGAGISLQPNAIKAVTHLGVRDQVIAAGQQTDFAKILSSNRKPVNKFEFGDYESRYGCFPMTIHRAALVETLHAVTDSEKVQVNLAEEFASFTEADGKVVARSTTGNEYECDALVGADGIHSNVRKQLWGDSPVKYAGYTCWRGIVSDPDILAKCTAMCEMWGKAARFGYMPCAADKVYWFATQNRPQRTDHLASDKEWRKDFVDWASPVPEILRVADDNLLVQNDIIDRDPIFPWGKDKVTLLGDAAHAMTPNFGQGGAQALEDAVVLSAAIEKFEDIETAFRAYEKHRHPRTKKFVLDSRRFGNIGQGGSVFMRFLRNSVLPRMPQWFINQQMDLQLDFESHLAAL